MNTLEANISNKIIQLYLVDDHEMFRETLSKSLARETNFKVIGSTGDGVHAINDITLLKPDVVLLDVSIEGLNGLDTLKLILNKVSSSRVIMLSMDTSRATVSRAMTNGALGYVTKGDNVKFLKQAIKTAMLGRRYLSPSLNLEESFANQLDTTEAKSVTITPREREIIQLAAEGCSTKAIARTLTLSEKTVEAHRSNVYQKLGINNLADLTRYAIRHGITSL